VDQLQCSCRVDRRPRLLGGNLGDIVDEEHRPLLAAADKLLLPVPDQALCVIPRGDPPHLENVVEQPAAVGAGCVGEEMMAGRNHHGAQAVLRRDVAVGARAPEQRVLEVDRQRQVLISQKALQVAGIDAVRVVVWLRVVQNDGVGQLQDGGGAGLLGALLVVWTRGDAGTCQRLGARGLIGLPRKQAATRQQQANPPHQTKLRLGSSPAATSTGQNPAGIPSKPTHVAGAAPGTVVRQAHHAKPHGLRQSVVAGAGVAVAERLGAAPDHQPHSPARPQVLAAKQPAAAHPAGRLHGRAPHGVRQGGGQGTVGGDRAPFLARQERVR